MVIIFIILSFNSILFTIETVKAGFFCDNFLREVYLIDESFSQKVIATGWEGFWKAPYIFDNLEAAPGDLIKFKCYNYDGWSFGAGCFLINNICRCYMFENDIKEFSDKISPYYGTVDFGSRQCNMNIYYLKEFNVAKDYYYQHYIPLDVDGIKCKNDYVLSIPRGTKCALRISDYIETDFDLKNLKISITENYQYFTLNNNKLTQNNKFKILEQLIFYSENKEKISIKFKNYGILLDNTKICELNIRVCYERCSDCYDIDPNNLNHQCKKCSEGYYFIKNTYNCMTKEEMQGTKYYFDKEKNMFLECHSNCLTCFDKGDNKDMKCSTCDDNKYLAEPNNCIEDITNYYYSEENKKYYKCYITCYSCFDKGNDNEHNCKICNDPYHFIYNEKGKCITENEKPTNTYLDKESNTYQLCYQRCSSCKEKGDNINNNCEDCLKDENNNYTYHFIYDEKGKCISENEKPTNTYLDKNTNTYLKCYERCSSCKEKGDNINNNCEDCLKDENNNYIYHFIYNEKGKCINENEKPTNTYLDKNINTYLKCYERCESCDSYQDCKECLKDESNNYIYHFKSNSKGKCLKKNELIDDYYYLDNKDNTYKKCPEGTVKVEDNKCVHNNLKLYIIIGIIIFIIILILIILFIIMRKRRKKKSKDLMEEAINLKQLY